MQEIAVLNVALSIVEYCVYMQFVFDSIKMSLV